MVHHNVTMARPFNAPDVYRAIGHPIRRRVLDLLQSRERSQSELLAEFKIAASTLSEHLRTLRVAGLVDSRDEGVQRIYRITSKRLVEVHAWAGRFNRGPAGQ